MATNNKKSKSSKESTPTEMTANPVTIRMSVAIDEMLETVRLRFEENDLVSVSKTEAARRVLVLGLKQLLKDQDDE